MTERDAARWVLVLGLATIAGALGAWLIRHC